jgi:hypothetical protein
MPPRLLALVLLTSVACLQDRDTLEPVAQAYADEVLAEATPALRAGLGMAAVGAAVCGHSLGDWQGMDTVTLPAELADWFGVEREGALLSYPATGQFAATWGGGRFFGSDVALKLSVATPMSAFTVSIDEATGAGDTGADSGIGEEGGGTLASAVLASTLCGSDEPMLSGVVSYPIAGDYGWELSLQAAEDDAGMAWGDDALVPSRGALSWSGSTELGRSALLTDDASSVQDGLWPATVTGRGWSAQVALEL